MRIAQVMLAKHFGGAERSFVDLCWALGNRGHEVLAICEHRSEVLTQLEGMDGVALRALKVHGPWDFVARHTIKYHLRDFNAHIAQLHLARAACLGGRAARTLGIPTLAKTHNYVNLKYYGAIDYLVPTTSKQHAYLLAAGIPAERVSLIPNFSSIDRCDGANRSRAAGRSRLRIAAVGRLVHKKGFDVLLHALAKARHHGLDFSCMIAGAGPDREALHRLCHELALEEVVRFVGWRDDVTDCLAGADVFVLPSRDEPFGIVCLEAMALGIPIIATRTDGPLEILDADTAILVEIDDISALARALDNVAAHRAPAQRRADVARVRFDQHYSEAVVVGQYLALYARMSAEDGGSKQC